jgi:hypothetical protein
MLSLEKFRALRITGEVAEALQEFNELDVSGYNIKLNSTFENSEAISHALHFLGFPHEVYNPSTLSKLSEFNLSIGKDINPQVIYYLVYLVSKFFTTSKIYLYISHATSGRSPFEIIAGSYITPAKKFFNVSRRIESSELLALDAGSLTTSGLHQLFPNVHYHSSGECMSHTDDDDNYFMLNDDDYDEGDGDYEDDSWGNNSDNEYYNDNLDMDQQSQEYWDNL